MSQIEAVVWDWNGTLLDDVEMCLGIVNDILAGFGLARLSRDRYLNIFDLPARIYWERTGVDTDRVDFGDVSRAFCELFDERLPSTGLHLGAHDLLADLRSAGLRQLLVSNTEHGALLRQAERFGVAPLFDAIRGMETGLAEGKLPAVQRSMRELSLEPESLVVIGDTSHDGQVARQLGASCILVAGGHQASHRLRNSGVLVAAALQDVPALIEAYSGGSRPSKALQR